VASPPITSTGGSRATGQRPLGSGRRGGEGERSVRHAKRTSGVAFKSPRVALCCQLDTCG
jgi:hypothetical protein